MGPQLVDYNSDDGADEMEDVDDVNAIISEDVRTLVNYLLSKVSKQSCNKSTVAYMFDLNAFRDLSSDDSSVADSDLEVLSGMETNSNSGATDSDDSELFMLKIDKKAGKIRTPPAQPASVKGELQLNELPCIEKLNISVDENVVLRPLGTPYSTVDQLVIIQSTVKASALDNGTKVFDENRKAIGEIFETFGPVRKPFYIVRFNNPREIMDCKLRSSQMLYYAAADSLTNFVFVNDLQKDKGSDASWVNDVEPPPESLDFSDDENQQLHYQKLKANKRLPDSLDNDALIVRKKRSEQTTPSSAAESSNVAIVDKILSVHYGPTFQNAQYDPRLPTSSSQTLSMQFKGPYFEKQYGDD